MSTVVSFNPSVGLLNAKSLALDDLHITFHRTIRMPETHDGSYVPPSMGMFQLSRSSDYDRMSKSLTGQSGVFFPMYQSEALWMRFNATEHRYAIKIYIDGINAISGQPINPSTKSRRPGSSRMKQDYIIVPGQIWLDGFAAGKAGPKRQFVLAKPPGKPTTAEKKAQPASKGIQFEICRLDTHDLGRHGVLVANILGGESFIVDASKDDTVSSVIDKVRTQGGISMNRHILLVYASMKLEESQSLGSYHMQEGDVVHVVLRPGPHGNGLYQPPRAPKQQMPSKQMHLGGGGLIIQSIVPDPFEGQTKASNTVLFNVLVLDTACMRWVTRQPCPPTPVSATTYQHYGMPFFSHYEENSRVRGSSSRVKSTRTLEPDGTEEAAEDRPAGHSTKRDSGVECESIVSRRQSPQKSYKRDSGYESVHNVSQRASRRYSANTSSEGL